MTGTNIEAECLGGTVVVWLIINCIILILWTLTFLCYCCTPRTMKLCPTGTSKITISDCTKCMKDGDMLPNFLDMIEVQIDKELIDEQLMQYWNCLMIILVVFLLVNVVSFIGSYLYYYKRKKYIETINESPTSEA